MEFVPLSNVSLRYLALDDPVLKRVFHGDHSSDGLPSRPTRTTRGAYIVNTDPRGEPGRHWLGLWTEKGTCEVMDSYGLPLTTYDAPELKTLLEQWRPVRWNGTDSASFEQYGLWPLCPSSFERMGTRANDDRLKGISPVDLVGNDRYVGQQVRRRIVEDLNALPSNQCCTAHEWMIKH